MSDSNRSQNQKGSPNHQAGIKCQLQMDAYNDVSSTAGQSDYRASGSQNHYQALSTSSTVAATPTAKAPATRATSCNNQSSSHYRNISNDPHYNSHLAARASAVLTKTSTTDRVLLKSQGNYAHIDYVVIGQIHMENQTCHNRCQGAPAKHKTTAKQKLPQEGLNLRSGIIAI